MPEFPSVIKSKLPNTGVTIFTTMSGLANEVGAINLSQGFPDFNPSEELIGLVNKYMKLGYNQYSPMAGVMALREAITAKVERLYGLAYDPETEITVTAGATIALYSAISAVVSEDDEVIIFEPAYDCYAPAVELSGGLTVPIELEAPTYKIDFEQLKRRINHKTRLIILNTPHNPTGSIIDKNDMLKLEKLVADTDIMVLSDEVYEHILFDKQQHQSVIRFPNLAERSFVVFSFGKSYHCTGWKMGYCLAPAKLMKEFRRVHQYQTFVTNTPIQYAFAEFMKKEMEYLQLSEFYQKKRDFFLDKLKGSSFTYQPAGGTYFQLLNYDDITHKADVDYAKELTKAIGVASIPISVFYHQKTDNHVLRFCFAKSEEVLEEAADKLKQL